MYVVMALQKTNSRLTIHIQLTIEEGIDGNSYFSNQIGLRILNATREAFVAIMGRTAFTNV